MTTKQNETAKQMMQFITGKWISKPIYVAAKLGISDILSERPMTIEEIAEKCNAYSPYLYRVMRTLASFSIYHEVEEKKFQLTPMAELLKTGSMRSIALMFLSDWHNQAWDKLLHSVTTGKSAFDLAHGMDAFQWFEKNLDEAKTFYEANNMKAIGTANAIINAYDFSGINTIADIGGGFGGLLIEILKNHSSMNGVIADLPHVEDSVSNKIISSGLKDKCKFIACDFFKEIPTDFEIYLMLNILHDWDDNNSYKILKNCVRAMSDNSKLLIIEMIIPGGNEFSISKLMDLEVLVMGGGAERTEKQYKELLNSAGLRINIIIPTDSDVHIIECEKVF